MTISKIPGSIKALTAAVNPHKEAVDLAEQQMDELAHDLVRDTCQSGDICHE